MAEHTVTIDPGLYDEAAELVRTTGAFESVDEYVNVVLAELFGRTEGGDADEAQGAALRQRLEDLGYM